MPKQQATGPVDAHELGNALTRVAAEVEAMLDVLLPKVVTAEARLMEAIDSPFVCRLIDFNQDGGRHYLVLEYLEGESLGQFLRRHVRLPEPLALVVTAAVAACCRRAMDCENASRRARR